MIDIPFLIHHWSLFWRGDKRSRSCSTLMACFIFLFLSWWNSDHRDNSTPLCEFMLMLIMMHIVSQHGVFVWILASLTQYCHCLAALLLLLYYYSLKLNLLHRFQPLWCDTFYSVRLSGTDIAILDLAFFTFELMTTAIHAITCCVLALLLKLVEVLHIDLGWAGFWDVLVST